MRRLLASFAFLAAIIPTATLAQAWEEIPGTRQTFGNWDLVAWKEGGRSGCSMIVGYANGAHMNFVLEGDQWRIRWWHPDWRYAVGQKLSVTFWVDGSPPHTVNAERVGSKDPWLLAVLPDLPELFDQFRTGTLLRVRVQGGAIYNFALTSTNAALAALRNCAARHRSSEPPPPPTASSGPRDGQSGRALPALTAEQRINAVRLAANLLTKMPGFRILNEEEQKAGNPALAKLEAAVVWRSEGVYGALHLFVNQTEASIPKLASAIAGGMSEQCKGKFTLTMEPDVRSALVRRIHVSCSDGTSSTVARIILMPWGKEGVYLFMTEGTLENDAAIVRAEELLRNALFEITQR
ncbi:MAG: hypothetical protein AB7O88_12180 [Reyranellaceae bacterium]